MARTQSRPNAGSMRQTIYSRVSEGDLARLQEVSLEMDRPISWIIRRALIQTGFLEVGK